MPAPVFSFYEEGSMPGTGTIINSGNKVSLLNMQKGIANPLITIDIWNDKGGGAGSDTAIAPKLTAVDGSSDMTDLFAGTAGNGFKSMLEARSCRAYGVASDQQTAWSPIGEAQLLVMGNMPSNTKRTVEIRVNVPLDAPDISLSNFSLKVLS